MNISPELIKAITAVTLTKDPSEEESKRRELEEARRQAHDSLEWRIEESRAHREATRRRQLQEALDAAGPAEKTRLLKEEEKRSTG